MGEKKVASVALVDRCVAAKIAFDKADAELKAAKKEIKDLLAVGDTAMGSKGTVSKSESATKILDTDKVFKKLGKAKFLTVSSVSITKLTDLVGKIEVDAFTKDFKMVEKLTIKPKK